jgi:flagellar basal-body rod modification protein FlgD
MSLISAITGSTSASANSPAAATGQSAASPQSTLTTQDFLQLLSTQLQNQDPLQPMDDTAYLAEMAQFTSLQQVNTLSNTVSVMSSSQQQLAAVSYIGANVTMNNGNNGTVSGQVTSVDTSGSTPQLQVNGTYYPLTSLLSVAPAAALATNSTTPSTN